MPALDSIEGLGDKAADAVVHAARDGQFLSKDDFQTADEGQQECDRFYG